jgi:hypothetical protein
MKMALDKVAFLPFGLLIDKWRWDVFSGKVTPAEYDASWWKLAAQYQGVSPPNSITEDDFDPGAKFHVASSTPYLRYFYVQRRDDLRERPLEELRVVPCVDKINFEVKRGEIVGFLGPNGAGKSTTMRILTCFISPTSGTARVNGHDVFDEPLKVRESLGYLPQRAPLYLEMSVLEYLRFAADLRHLDDDTVRKRAQERRRGVRPRAGARARRSAPVARLPAARRPRPGAHPRPADPHPRRADERPRPEREGRVSRLPEADRQGAHGPPLDAQPGRGRAGVRPRHHRLEGAHRRRRPARRDPRQERQGPVRRLRPGVGRRRTAARRAPEEGRGRERARRRSRASRRSASSPTDERAHAYELVERAAKSICGPSSSGSSSTRAGFSSSCTATRRRSKTSSGASPSATSGATRHVAPESDAGRRRRRRGDDDDDADERPPAPSRDREAARDRS